jgi:hemerythrin
MSAIQWSDEYSVGIPSIDEQHKVLINFINDLNRAMADGEANVIIGDILLGLGQYTKKHFKYEEELFTQYGYPSSEPHVKEHQLLLEQVSSLKLRFESDLSGSISLEIMQFLKNWLVNHIQQSDKEYSQFLISKGAK